MKKTLYLLTFLAFAPFLLHGQSCSDPVITLSTQTDVDDFAINYGCAAIAGQLVIGSESGPQRTALLISTV